jgi:putative ABC transport system permease protein
MVGLSTLDTKLIRDLVRLWPQGLATALVVAAGFSTLIVGVGARRSIEDTRTAYYERYAFADVFASLKRAPRALRDRILKIPSVRQVEVRMVERGLLDISGLVEPASGLVISLPDHQPQRLNKLFLRKGRMPEAGKTNEVIINEAFAKAHDFQPGNHFKAILNGKLHRLDIVGVALSPEFIYAIGPGDLVPDDKRFAVMWLSQRAVESLFDLDGAFNSVLIKLEPGHEAAPIIAVLDRLLEKYGGTGAVARKDQQSHAFLDNEIQQLTAMSAVIPPIFLAVAMFLMNMILARVVALEREQIGLLKALGYGRSQVSAHYIKFVLVIAAGGCIIGAAFGTWLGRGLTRLYAEFFHFPFLIFSKDFDLYVLATAICAAAALLGALKSAITVFALPPAVAMRPPSPPLYRRRWKNGYKLLTHISKLTIMALRQMAHSPGRSLTTLIGLSLATSLLVTAWFNMDSIEAMIDVSFFKTARQHATLNLIDEKSIRVLDEVKRLPGILNAEPYRIVDVRLKNGHLSRRTAISGLRQGAELNRVIDTDLEPVPLPSRGLLINARLARVLDLKPGQSIDVEIMEGRARHQKTPLAHVFGKPVTPLPSSQTSSISHLPGTKQTVVSDVVESYIGLGAYMELSALNTFVDEGPRINGVHITYDPLHEAALYSAIKRTPVIGSMVQQTLSLRKFRNTIGENINIITTLYIFLSSIIAIGVVYNSARIQFSERARELASLRVLGFTNAEVSRVLLTELIIIVLLAQPLGWWLGYSFAGAVIEGFESDLFTIPFVIEPATYAKSSLVVMAASAVSVLIVRRRLRHLDLITILKTRD